LYFSLQDGNGKTGQCFCDNDLDHAKKYGAKSCGVTGGSWCNYIY